MLANENNLAAIYMLGVHFREPDPMLAIEYGFVAQSYS